MGPTRLSIPNFSQLPSLVRSGMASQFREKPEAMLVCGFQEYDIPTISCAFAHAIFSM